MKTKRPRAAAVTIAAGFLWAMTACCSPGPFGIRSCDFGKDISPRGHAIKAPLTYTFRRYTRGGTGRDLFNFLYFEGDTICFSVKFSEPVIHARAEAWFINPANGKRYRVERLETSGSIVWGFSLVGSIMEKFFHEMSTRPVPRDAFCCRDIPFELHIALRKPGRKIITARYRKSFRIMYR